MNIEVIIHVYFLVTMCCNLIEQEKQVLMKLTLLAWLYSPPVVHIFLFRFARLKFE